MPESFNDKVTDSYFEWLYERVCRGRVHEGISYRKIFEFLFRTEFTFIIERDINRAKDGENLRYRFVRSTDYNIYYQDDMLNVLNGPCSVLEMMIALAMRCEEFMDDTRYGDRTGQWFWIMMTNLGIGHMNDERFDFDDAEQAVYSFLDRNYEPDGKGGLFHIKGCEEDLRDVEIWSQLCWYLNEHA